MSPRGRMIMFILGAFGLALLYGSVMLRLPGPLQLRDRYLNQINSRVFAERNITDAVTAVNFDYRGFDTVGEEFILFVSVMGSLVLLRQAEEKEETELRDADAPYRDVGPSDAIQMWTLAMVAPKLLFGIYIVIHGQLSPGGGFQGGVILASVALIIYLGTDFKTYKRIMSHPLVEWAEAGGAAAFVLIGMLAWFWAKPYLTDTLPLGKSNELSSGGTIALISAATGVEVMAGFALLLYAFLQELLVEREE